MRLVRPKVPEGVRIPILLTYSPYALLGASANDAFFLSRGCARAVADVVGTGNSGGCWDYGGAREQVSSWDLVEHLGFMTDSGTATESEALRFDSRTLGGGDIWFFETAELGADLRIAGVPKLTLQAQTLGTSTHFTPVLFDLGVPVTQSPSLCTFLPSRQACVISRGFLNARYRNGLARGQDIDPLTTYTATVRLIDNDWVVKAGHRIGVALMASNVWWATPDPQRASTVVELSASRLDLPIVGGGAAADAAGI